MKGKFKLPSAYTILFILIAIVAVFTWFIPAGQYQVNDAGDIIAETYKSVSQQPQGIWDILMAPIKGMLGTETTPGAIDISLFILVIGGFLGVVNSTGALDAGIASIIKKQKGREKILIPLLMVLFALGGSTFGMAEETIPFYMLLIPVMMSVGFDSITAIGTILIGSQVGCLASTINPFATGVASQTANISPSDGLGLRIFMLVVLLAISIFYVYRYASKIQKDPTKSLVYSQRTTDQKYFKTDVIDQQKAITGKQKAVNAVFFGTFILMLVSLIPWSDIFKGFTFFEDATKWLVNLPFIGTLIGKDAAPLGTWYFMEITMLFMLAAIVVAFVYKIKEPEFIRNFMTGASDMIGVAFVVAIARGIQVVMNDGMMTDTILRLGEQSLSGLSSGVFIVLTYIFYLPMSFLIPSTSGLASATIGIIGPMGEFAGVSKSLVVTAFQSASGLINLITPTSAVVMGALAIGRTNIGVWFKFVGKLVAILFVATAVILAVAATFGM